MPLDLDQLVTAAADTRTALVEAEERERDRRAGLTALRPAIALLEADVRPALDAAKEALAPVGIRMDIDEGWADFIQGKRATLAIRCMTGDGWPGACTNVRGDYVIITAAAGELSVATKPAHDREAVGEPLICEPGEEVAAAIEHAVTTFLDRVRAGPTMHGVEVRGLRSA